MKTTSSQQNIFIQKTKLDNLSRINLTKCLPKKKGYPMDDSKEKKTNNIVSDSSFTHLRKVPVTSRLKSRIIIKNMSNYNKKIVTADTPVKMNSYRLQNNKNNKNNTTIKVNKKNFTEGSQNTQSSYDPNKTISPIKQTITKKIFVSKLKIKNRYSKKNTLYENIFLFCQIIQKMLVKKYFFKLNFPVFVFKKMKIRNNKKQKLYVNTESGSKCNYSTSSSSNPVYCSNLTDKSAIKNHIVTSFSIKKSNSNVNKSDTETPVHKSGITAQYNTNLRNSVLNSKYEWHSHLNINLNDNLNFSKNSVEKNKLTQKSNDIFIKSKTARKINNKYITLRKPVLRKRSSNSNQILLKNKLYIWKDITLKLKIIDLLVKSNLGKKLRNIFSKNIIFIHVMMKRLHDLTILKKYFNLLKYNKETKNERIKLLQNLKFYCAKKILKKENKINENTIISEINSVNYQTTKRNGDIINNININNYIHCGNDLSQLPNNISQVANSSNIISKVIDFTKNKSNKNLVKHFIPNTDKKKSAKSSLLLNSKLNSTSQNVVKMNQILMAVNLVEERIIKKKSLTLMDYFNKWKKSNNTNKIPVINEKVITFQKYKSSNLLNTFYEENCKKNKNQSPINIIQNNNFANGFNPITFSNIFNGSKIDNMKNLNRYPSTKYVTTTFNPSFRNTSINKIDLSNDRINQNYNNRYNYISEVDLFNRQIINSTILYGNYYNFKNSLINSTSIPNHPINYIHNYNFGTIPINNINRASLVFDRVNDSNIYCKKTPKLTLKNKKFEEKKAFKIEEKELVFGNSSKNNCIKQDGTQKSHLENIINDQNDSSDFSDADLDDNENRRVKLK